MGTVGTQDNRACSGVPIVIVQFPSARTRSRACQDPATRDEAERWETPAPAQVLVAQEAERSRAPMRRTGGGMRAAHSLLLGPGGGAPPVPRVGFGPRIN